MGKGNFPALHLVRYESYSSKPSWFNSFNESFTEILQIEFWSSLPSHHHHRPDFSSHCCFSDPPPWLTMSMLFGEWRMYKWVGWTEGESRPTERIFLFVWLTFFGDQQGLRLCDSSQFSEERNGGQKEGRTPVMKPLESVSGTDNYRVDRALDQLWIEAWRCYAISSQKLNNRGLCRSGRRYAHQKQLPLRAITWHCMCIFNMYAPQYPVYYMANACVK